MNLLLVSVGIAFIGAIVFLVVKVVADFRDVLREKRK